MEWFFDGVGTELVSIVIGLIFGTGVGGIAGYKIGVNKSVLKQNQKAGADSRQKQIGKPMIDALDGELNIESSNSKIIQNQKAGNEAIQIQIGGTGRGK